MVLGAITVLTVFLTELQEQTSSDLAAALSERDALQAEYHAKSAVNLARLLMASEPTVRMAILKTPFGLMMRPTPKQIPVWEHSDLLLGPFNDKESGDAFGSTTGLDISTAKNIGLGDGKGHFELRIIDEDSKINVNTAAGGVGQDRIGAQLLGLMQPVQYNPLFEQQDADGQFSDRATVCGAIIDWTDPDENLYTCDPFSGQASVGGAEDNFYQSIGLDYQRKNAAYDSLDELRLVRGMGEDFWATFVDPDPSSPEKRVLTVWGLETININTANAQTLLAVICANAVSGGPCENPEQASSFIMGVTLLRSVVPGIPLFSSPKQLTKLMTTGEHAMLGNIFGMFNIEPVVFKSESFFEKSLGVQSKRFSIYADGVVPGYKRETRVRIHAVIAIDNAQPLGTGLAAALGGAGAPGGGAPGAAGPSLTGPVDASGSGTDATGDQAVLGAQPDYPGGTVIYWRVE